jgi:membrane-bound metal-dependent hydrolase YbcI (DUF457 family)
VLELDSPQIHYCHQAINAPTMIAPTHITFAGFIYLLLLTTTGVALSLVNVLVIALASILPDADTGASIVGKAVPFLSRRIERRFGHRTLTHSIPFVAGLAILLSPLLAVSKDLYICLVIGYATHPFLDSMTVNGVKLFYPFSNVRCVFPLEVNNPHRYRVQTGSRMDKALGVIFFLACVPTFLISHQGYERFIRFAQRNIESAVRDYNEFSQTHRVRARVSAHSMLTKERINGEFEIVGSLNDHTLLFRGSDGQLHTLGKQYRADYVANEVVCERGALATTTVTTIDLANQSLSQLALYLDPAREHHLFGHLNASEPVTLPQETQEFLTITGTATALRFHFASYDDIRRLRLENTFITRGILTVRTIHSAQTPKPDPVQLSTVDTTSSFHSITFDVDSRETVEYAVSVGDSIKPDNIIARKTLPRFFRQQIELNNRRIEGLQTERNTKVTNLNHRLNVKALQVRTDSLKLVKLKELNRDGFTTHETVVKSQKSLDLLRDELSSIHRSIQTIDDKTEVQIAKLQTKNEQLRAKEALAELQSIVRSNIEGVVMDIRQSHVKGKTRVTLIIRRHGTQQ